MIDKTDGKQRVTPEGKWVLVVALKFPAFIFCMGHGAKVHKSNVIQKKRKRDSIFQKTRASILLN